jgi:4-amino-4-deoxy-L-arabinose transferase-like glycosyltransferase
LGLGIGLIILARPTGFIFILIPGIWTLITFVTNRKSIKLTQSGLSLISAWLICSSCYSVNSLIIITSALHANSFRKREGDPSVTPITRWLLYPPFVP